MEAGVVEEDGVVRDSVEGEKKRPGSAWVSCWELS